MVSTPSLLTSATGEPRIFGPAATYDALVTCHRPARGDHQNTNNSPPDPRPARCSTVSPPDCVTHAVTGPATVSPASADAFTTCHRPARGDHQNTNNSPPDPRPARCSTVSPPDCVTHAVTGPATVSPASADAFTTCHRPARGDHQNTNNSPPDPRPARCSTVSPPDCVTHAVTGPATVSPASADAFTTCHRPARGDHQNTNNSPPDPRPARCSTVSPPDCVTHAVTGPATVSPASADAFTTCHRPARGDHQNTNNSPPDPRPARCSTSPVIHAAMGPSTACPVASVRSSTLVSLTRVPRQQDVASRFGRRTPSLISRPDCVNPASRRRRRTASRRRR